MGGKTTYHDRLENGLAALMNSEDALVYTSGFLTSFSTVAAFVGVGDVVIGDSLNHASIVDGCRMSGARFVNFAHGELDALERALAENPARTRSWSSMASSAWTATSRTSPRFPDCAAGVAPTSWSMRRIPSEPWARPVAGCRNTLACPRMLTTLVEIETVVDALPRHEQRKLLKRLAEKLAQKTPAKKPSLHDRMKDGCGIVDSGIPDLATNKKHMEGFGRWRTK